MTTTPNLPGPERVKELRRRVERRVAWYETEIERVNNTFDIEWLTTDLDIEKDIIRILDEHAALQAEVERLDYLHKLDHSLADQWLARAEKAEALASERLEFLGVAERLIIRDTKLRAEYDAFVKARAEKAEAELAAARPLIEAANYEGELIFDPGCDRPKRNGYRYPIGVEDEIIMAALALREKAEKAGEKGEGK